MALEPFRPSALQRLSSPEQLDQLFTYADPRGWLALGALAGLLLLALLWGVFGSVSTRVVGQGILLKKGGVFDVAAPGSGMLVELAALRSGDEVHKGQVVGHIAQPLLEQEIRLAEGRLEAARRESAPGREGRIGELEDRLELLRARADLAGRVVTPYHGRVVEMKANAGDVVAEGRSLFSIEFGERTLEAVVYLPPQSEIKRVRPGAAVQVSPNTARREEYGFLLGRVTALSEFPASRQGMMALLNNEALVQLLSQQGAPFAVRVELERDPASASSYRWSSAAGAALEVSSGTLCTASVLLREQPPITLVVPWLKRFFGVS